jgi:hypothetical protein
VDTAYRPELWRDLYVMLGTSSAALIGLLFVVTSLHLDEIVNNPGYQLRARSNSIYLIMTLAEAACVLTPQPMWFLGVEVTAFNGLGLLIPIKNLIFIYRHRQSAWRGGFALYRAFRFILGFLLGIAGGICLLAQSNWGLYLLSASYVLFLVSVSLNAWSIMLGVGQGDKTGKANRARVRKKHA